MAIVKPFRALRPTKEFAENVASPPYDVLSSDEAREMAKHNPISFLHVNKPEIDLEKDIDVYDERVYKKGAENLHKLIEQKIMVQEDTPKFYVYKQIMGQHQQIGLVACASVEEYKKNIIKKHELTRPEKEDDRVNHINHLNAQVGPVFLTYQADEQIDQFMRQITEEPPEYDFIGNDGVRHVLWVVHNSEDIKNIQQAFGKIDYLYVADGHHRSAAAMRVQEMREADNPHHSGDEEYNFFLVVIFPHNQMQILDYNRIVKDLNGLSGEEFLQTLNANFLVNKIKGNQSKKPEETHQLSLYLNGQWYQLIARDGTFDKNDPVGRLDVSILQENVLSPILDITDPRKDKRIDFVGGIRGLEELETRVDSGDWQAAFAMFPTSIEDLMAIADANKIMPPKSTWFEPKLKSGLFVHLLD